MLELEGVEEKAQNHLPLKIIQKEANNSCLSVRQITAHSLFPNPVCSGKCCR